MFGQAPVYHDSTFSECSGDIFQCRGHSKAVNNSDHLLRLLIQIVIKPHAILPSFLVGKNPQVALGQRLHLVRGMRGDERQDNVVLVAGIDEPLPVMTPEPIKNQQDWAVVIGRFPPASEFREESVLTPLNKQCTRHVACIIPSVMNLISCIASNE